MINAPNPASRETPDLSAGVTKNVDNRPVVYHSQNHNQQVYAQPVTVYANGCKDVRVQVYENGRLVRAEMTQVCG